MLNSNQGVKRPILYFLAAILAIALAVPLAATSGQMQTGGIFDECYGESCKSATLLANAD